MEYIIQLVTWFISDLWYTWIFFMMVLESTFFPFPSEIAMVPAWYLSSVGDMNFAIAFLAGTLWAIIGSCINYLIWWKLGAPIIKKVVEKYGKFVFLSVEHYNKTEYFFLDHGSVATFLWRLVTGIRQIISLPAWVFKMHFWKFLFYTGAWAWLWNLILMIIWYLAWENQELIKQYSFVAFIASFIIVGISAYLYFQRRKYPNTLRTAGLILINNQGKILIQDRASISRHGEKWALFGGHIEYAEKAKDAIIREIQEELNMNISHQVKKLWKLNIKIPERHLIAKRNFFYMKTDKDISEIEVLEGDGAKFIDPEELRKLEWFYLKWASLDKLLFLIKKAKKRIEIQEKKELKNKIYDEYEDETDESI